MSVRGRVPLVALSVLFGSIAPARAQEPLDVATYVEIVLRAHPAARVGQGLEGQGGAEAKGLWAPPDPRVEYSRGRAHPPGSQRPTATETGWSISQTIPWPGTTAAGVRAAQRSADGIRAEGQATRWGIEVAARQAFDGLVAARALLDIDERTEGDARSLRDLVARRAELGETRESDRIKATVEGMKQRRLLEATRRDVAAAESVLRLLAVEPLPQPLVLRAAPLREVAPTDREAIVKRLPERNPSSPSPERRRPARGETVADAVQKSLRLAGAVLVAAALVG